MLDDSFCELKNIFSTRNSEKHGTRIKNFNKQTQNIMNRQEQTQALEKNGEKIQDGAELQDLIRLKKF